LGCSALTLFIDVQQKALFWMLCGWEQDFTGYVIDYGTWPDQKRTFFMLRDIRRTLALQKPDAGLEGAIYNGLEKLCDERLGRVYRREDGLDMRIDRCLIDANWGQSTDVVYQFCRQSKYSGLLLPSHGKYVGASSIQFSEYKRKKGDRLGLHWRIPGVVGKRSMRYVLIDTNYWKSFMQARLSVAMGDPGALSLFGREGATHVLLADHLVSEYCVLTEARGRIIGEWKLKLTRPDNHWLDCLVGCGVAASMLGIRLFGTETAEHGQQKKRLKLSDLAR
jgi:phage terminase large subunit GpA-like protein